jgi:hypothetical protein
MPRNPLGKAPFPLRMLDTDDPMAEKDLLSNLRSAGGSVTLCIRSVRGHSDRGGFFFNICVAEDGLYQILDFKGSEIDRLPMESLVRLVNHVSGRKFDQDMWVYCQTVLNFRQDQNESD